MKLVPVAELFRVSYGTSLELSALELSPDGVPFVSRTSNNNGVSALVDPPKDIVPIPAGTLTVALSGNGVMSTFLQERPYVTAYHVAVLSPIESFNRDTLLFYAACLRANRFRFSYGRQANRSLGTLMVPSPGNVPVWARHRTPKDLDRIAADGLPPASDDPISTADWKPFKYTDLFEIVRGKGPSLAEAKESPGVTPYVTASDLNNGVAAATKYLPTHPGKVLTVAKDGAPGATFFQPDPFCANSHVHVLSWKSGPLTPASGLALATLVRQEMPKFGYGRAWGLSRLSASTLALPAKNGQPDLAALEALVRRLPAFGVLCQNGLA